MRIYISIFLLLLLGACASDPNASQAVRGCYSAVETSNDLAHNALEQDHITVEQACTVSEWSKVAIAGCDSARDAWLIGKPDDVPGYVSAAMRALDGISREAQDRARWSCKRQESN